MGKNLRLLGLLDPPGRQQDIYEIIRGLETEIDKGIGTYTDSELLKLDARLAEYREILRVLTNP